MQTFVYFQLFHSISIWKYFIVELPYRSHFFLLSDSSKVGEVRCYCNEPKCVPQGYMCRGIRCFTKLPTSVNLPLLRAGYSGCLNSTFKKDKCPEDFLCCDQDLCNHEDNPAMRNRLNKTLREGSTVFSSLFAFPVLQHSGHRIYHVSIIAI